MYSLLMIAFFLYTINYNLEQFGVAGQYETVIIKKYQGEIVDFREKNGNSWEN